MGFFSETRTGQGGAKIDKQKSSQELQWKQNILLAKLYGSAQRESVGSSESLRKLQSYLKVCQRLKPRVM